jgi:N-acetylmuramoyl-L-alanine amidase
VSRSSVRRWAAGLFVLAVLGAAGVAVAAQLADQGAPAPPPQAASHHRTTVDTGLSTTVLPSTGSTSAPAPPPPPHLPRPHIVWKPIPFPAHRLAETAAYAQRHYGIDTWHLRHPHVIVEHYTESTTMESAWALFAQDVPDSELHELPGTCAHFIVDRDGTIYQLVRLDVICRHTVGLNSTAFGVENVGLSDADVLGDAAQMRASLHLTAWLMQRYHIPLGDVIGHAESLTSPYHHELDPALRCQTHADFPTAAMDVYRHRLRALLRRYRIPLGPAVRRVTPSC